MSQVDSTSLAIFEISYQHGYKIGADIFLIVFSCAFILFISKIMR